MENIKKAVELYLQQYPPALELFEELMLVGNVYLIGGILREYRDKGRIEELRDADFIIDIIHLKAWEQLLEKYRPERNNFGGYKFCCLGFWVDIWKAEETWAYREKCVDFEKNEYLHTLPRTVFLNLDSIIYDINLDKWYDTIYQDAKRSGVLDVVLQENPYIDLNILRAMVLRKKYQMIYSQKLKDIVGNQRKKDPCYVDTLLQIQFNRYRKEIVSRYEIEQELKMLGV